MLLFWLQKAMDMLSGLIKSAIPSYTGSALNVLIYNFSESIQSQTVKYIVRMSPIKSKSWY